MSTRELLKSHAQRNRKPRVQSGPVDHLFRSRTKKKDIEFHHEYFVRHVAPAAPKEHVSIIAVCQVS